MDDRDGRAAVDDRQLPLEDDVSDLPAPARHAVLQLERGEVHVAARVDGAVGPFVHRQTDPCVASHEDRVERREAEHPAPRRLRRDHEQAVVAARAQPADRPHREAAEAVGDEPFAGGGGSEIAAQLTSETHRVHQCPRAPRRYAV